jgi:caffeoyl-CoA O-methyltransferase
MKLVDPEIEKYCIDMSSKPSSLCEELADFTRKNVSQSQMLIGPLEAAVLGFLIRTGGYRRVLEIGTFTGYSALTMAENLPDEGEIITLDINPETTEVAKRFWARSEFGSKIKCILGAALESFQKIDGDFDLIFIDADKEPYPHYLEWALDHLRDHGSIVIDNTLWSGEVLNPAAQGSTKSIQRVNQMAKELSNRGYYICFLPVRDGMLLIRKI